MTHVIDSITHSLNTAQIAKLIGELFMQDCEMIHVVMLASDAKQFPPRLRVAITRMWDDNEIDKHSRLGVRTSEPFPYTFADGREGKFTCIAVTPYKSKTKSIARAFTNALKEFAL
jgi:hypothetical protein